MVNLEAGKVYRFINIKALTVADLSNADSKSVVGCDWHGGKNQCWEAQRQGSRWTFKNVASGKYLGIDGFAENGRHIVAVDEAFPWYVESVDGSKQSVVRLFVPNTPQNIDLSDHGNPTPGTVITLWEKTSGVNQHWWIEQVFN